MNYFETDLVAMAAEEASRLYEKFFHHYHPWSVDIDTAGVPFEDEERFCRLVEEEIAAKGEKIRRNGRYFKIDKYQAH